MYLQFSSHPESREGSSVPIPNCTGVSVAINGVTTLDHQETKLNHPDHRVKAATTLDHQETKLNHPDHRVKAATTLDHQETKLNHPDHGVKAATTLDHQETKLNCTDRKVKVVGVENVAISEPSSLGSSRYICVRCVPRMYV